MVNGSRAPQPLLPCVQAQGGYLPAAMLAEQAADSYEGGPRRCFRHMFVCMDNINITGWPLHEYGQHLVRHYERLGALSDEKLPRERHPEATQRRIAAAMGGAGSSSSKADRSREDTEAVLQIVFQRRGEDRKLLNADELVEACNRWRHTTSFGVEVRAKCWQVGRESPTEAEVLLGWSAGQ
jgi:hypothetical protein